MAEIAAFRGFRPSPRAGAPGELLGSLTESSLHQRLSEGAFVQDSHPALYRYHQAFVHHGKGLVRKSFIALVRLASLADGVILPYDRRAALFPDESAPAARAPAQMRPLAGFYVDKDHKIDAAFADVEAHPPELEARTPDGVSHRLWPLVSSEAQARVVDFLDGEKLYLAEARGDYEALLRSAAVPPPRRCATPAPVYGTMSLCNLDDPGLVLRPTHRLLFDLPRFDCRDLLRRAREFFRVLEGPRADVEVVRQALAGHGRKGPTFAMLTPGTPTVVYFQLRGDLIRASVPALAASKALGDLDVTFLDALLLENILGLARPAQAMGANLRYEGDRQRALAEVEAPGVQAVFLLNPPTVEQVRAVVDEGESMPPHSTDFFPLPAGGMVIHFLVGGDGRAWGTP